MFIFYLKKKKKNLYLNLSFSKSFLFFESTQEHKAGVSQVLSKELYV